MSEEIIAAMSEGRPQNRELLSRPNSAFSGVIDPHGNLVGEALIGRLRDLTLAIYARGVEHAATCGIIIADTKFEFGVAHSATPSGRSPDGAKADGVANGQLILIDEILTPDSSRFWPADVYAPGRSQASFDKQFVRDYLEQIGWNKQPPVPELPPDVVGRTRAKYIEAYRRLSGREWQD